MGRNETKVFKVSNPEEAEPLRFALEFKPRGGGTKEVHEFEAQAHPGAGAAFVLGSVMRWDENDQMMADLNGMRKFLQRVLLGDSWERLNALLDRDDVEIPIEDLGEVMEWLVKEQTGRPTQASPASSGGRRSTGRTSTGQLSYAG